MFSSSWNGNDLVLIPGDDSQGFKVISVYAGVAFEYSTGCPVFSIIDKRTDFPFLKNPKLKCVFYNIIIIIPILFSNETASVVFCLNYTKLHKILLYNNQHFFYC